MWGVLYKPHRLPEHLAVFPQIAPFFLHHRRHRLSSPRPSSSTRRTAPLRRASPPRHVCSAVSHRRRARPRQCPPSPSLTRIFVPDAEALPDVAALPNSLPPPSPGPWSLHSSDRAPTLLLGGDPRPSSSVAASYSRYASPPPPMPPLAGSPLLPPAGVRVPDGQSGAGGFALLTSARQMLASASIFNSFYLI
jgi:hypothetical protein